MTVSRRDFIVGAAGTLLAGGAPACVRSDGVPAPAAPSQPSHHPTSPEAPPAPVHAPAPRAAASPFRHGVASGDPLVDRVLLWTRVSADPGATVAVEWQCAEDARFSRLVAAGQGRTDARHDHTFRVDVAGLAPGREYFYRFHAHGWDSPVGRTRTLPAGEVARARFALASCANYVRGHFNGYACIAEHDDLDAVLHVGDYIYEYPAGKYASGVGLGREHVPLGETITLEDYRQRYAQYRSDPDLQAAHARHPFVCVWDDHESTNNSWRDGAENHDAGEGSWPARKAAAIQAYLEWLPVRPPRSVEPQQIHRSFRYGDLVDIFMLDGRMVGRDQPLEARDASPEQIHAPSRSMLGQAQERWLYDGLRASKSAGVAWRLLGQQTMMGQLRRPDGRIGNGDQWDGYHAARGRLLDVLAGGVDDVAVLTGDIHSSWGVELAPDPFDAARYDPRTGDGALAVELICPGITSPSPYGPPDQARRTTEYFLGTHPHVKYQEAVHRGYLVVDVTKHRTRAEWHHVSQVEQPSREHVLSAAYEVERGRARLLRA